MTNYRAILQYYSQGSTTTQIATICQCSRNRIKDDKKSYGTQFDTSRR